MCSGNAIMHFSLFYNEDEWRRTKEKKTEKEEFCFQNKKIDEKEKRKKKYLLLPSINETLCFILLVKLPWTHQNRRHGSTPPSRRFVATKKFDIFPFWLFIAEIDNWKWPIISICDGCGQYHHQYWVISYNYHSASCFFLSEAHWSTESSLCDGTPGFCFSRFDKLSQNW